MESTAEQTAEQTEQTAQRAVKKSMNVMTIFDGEFNTIEIPIKVPSGKVIYDVNKILGKFKKDESALKVGSEAMNKIGKKLRPFLKVQQGETFNSALHRAMMDAFSEGKIDLSDVTEFQGGTTTVADDISDFNRRLMLEVFVSIIDYEQLEKYVPDAAVRAEITDIDTLYDKYPMRRINEEVDVFLRLAGLR